MSNNKNNNNNNESFYFVAGRHFLVAYGKCDA